MSNWRETFRRLRYLGRRSRFDDELETEAQFHIETRADELQQTGMSRLDAVRQARREFESPARMREETRAAWQFRWLEDLASDLRYAARSFRRNPAFALTAIACLALGIGANTTIFSIAAEVLFSQPSVRDPHTLVHMEIGGSSAAPIADYRFLRDARVFAGLAGENEETEANWRSGDSTTRLSVVRVTDNFFEVTGIPVAMGRPIQPGEAGAVVITHGFWQRRLGGAPGILGSKLLSVVLLSAGFLFLRNLIAASTLSPGFDAARVVWTEMRLVPEAYRDGRKVRLLADAAVERLRALPGVEAASIARVVPLNGHLTNGMDLVTDLQPRPTHVTFNTNYVGPDYFRVMQIPVIEGRGFQPIDRKGSPRVAILNENLARRLFGTVDPVGHTLRLGKDARIEIVGVARNSKYFTLGEDNAFAYYEPYAQQEETADTLQLLVRSAARPEPLVPAINAALGQLDSTAALDTKPMSRALVFAMLPSRVGAAILGSMGLLGLMLASIGLYGALLYSVSRRIREIGVRVALGATPAAVLRLVVRQSAALSAIGIAIGIALAVFAVRPLAMFLSPEVRPADWSNFVVVGAVLAAVAMAAAVAPAARALRVDPALALRHE